MEPWIWSIVNTVASCVNILVAIWVYEIWSRLPSKGYRTAYQDLLQAKEDHLRTIWALLAECGGEIRVSQVTLMTVDELDQPAVARSFDAYSGDVIFQAVMPSAELDRKPNQPAPQLSLVHSDSNTPG